jgi:hypothetical protein
VFCFVLFLNQFASWAVVAQAFNPSTWEAEAGRFLNSRPAWFTYKKKKNQFADCQFPASLCLESSGSQMASFHLPFLSVFSHGVLPYRCQTGGCQETEDALLEAPERKQVSLRKDRRQRRGRALWMTGV